MRDPASLTVYFDGSCALCRLEVDHFSGQRGGERLSLVDVSNPSADIGPDLDRHAAMSRFHVREPNGRLRSGADAFVAIWSRLPLYRPAAAAARLPGAKFLLEIGYRGSQPFRPVAAKVIRQVRA